MALIPYPESNPTPGAGDLDQAIRVFCHFGLSDWLRDRLVPSLANVTRPQDICVFPISAGFLSWQDRNVELLGPPVKENLLENEANTEKHSDVWAFAFSHI